MSNATITDTLRRSILEGIESGELTYKGLGRDTGVSRMSIMRFASGKRSLRLDMADKLAEYFGLGLAKRKAGG